MSENVSNFTELLAENSFSDDDFVTDLQAQLREHPQRKKLPKLGKSIDQLTWNQISRITVKAGLYYTHSIISPDGREVEQEENEDFTKQSVTDANFLSALVNLRKGQWDDSRIFAQDQQLDFGLVNKVETGNPALADIQKYAAAVGALYTHSFMERDNLLDEYESEVESLINEMVAAGRDKEVYKLTRILLREYHSKKSNKTREDLLGLLDSYRNN